MREDFLEKCKSDLSERDYRIVEKSTDILMKNIMPSGPDVRWHPYRAIAPSMFPPDYPGFPGIWNWDSAFHMIGVARFDKELAHEQMRAFFLLQKENGLLPDVATLPSRGNQLIDQYGKPPVWAWALEMTDRRQRDDDFLKEMYPKLVKNENFWRAERYNEQDGLYFYSTTEQGEKRDLYIRWESGLDDSIRFDDGVIEYLYPIDLNCFMAQYYRSMQYLADRQGLADDVKKWREREKALADRINSVLWSDEDQCYWDWNFRNKEFIKVVTPAIYMPLWAGVATSEQASKLERFALDPKKLYPCMPTVAFDDPKMDPTGYWRGPVWLNVAFFAIKGLYDYGFIKTALDIRNTLLDWVDKNPSIWENYQPITGEGKGSYNFSWSCVFAMEMIFEIRGKNDASN